MPKTMHIFLGLLMTLGLAIIPLPDIIHSFRPCWTLLFILYIQFYLPQQFRIIVVLIFGLCLDVLMSSVLGEHGLALLLAIGLASTKARRFTFFTLGQQTLFVGCLCFLYQLTFFAIDGLLAYHVQFSMMLASTFVSMLMWPWLRVLADDVFSSRPFRAS